MGFSDKVGLSLVKISFSEKVGFSTEKPSLPEKKWDFLTMVTSACHISNLHVGHDKANMPVITAAKNSAAQNDIIDTLWTSQLMSMSHKNLNGSSLPIMGI